MMQKASISIEFEQGVLSLKGVSNLAKEWAKMARERSATDGEVNFTVSAQDKIEERPIGVSDKMDPWPPR